MPAATNGLNETWKEIVLGPFIAKLVASLAPAVMVASVGLSPASAAEQVPFTAHYSGSLSFTDPTHIQLTGTGIASKLGQDTNSGRVTILGLADCGGYIIHGEETLTAANGDQLSWAVDDVACPTDTPGVFRVSATYTITGGTGRFAGVTGQGTVECVGDFVNLTFDITATGTISRPLG